MSTTKRERIARFYSDLSALGFSFEESETLRRIQMTFHRWDEMGCGDGNDYASWSVERDDQSGKPFLVTHPHTGKSYRRAIPDREKGAEKRLAKLMASHPDFVAYRQGDCRGCALYIVRKTDIPAGASIDSLYNRGFAVCF